MTSPTPVALVGATGLTGSAALTHLLKTTSHAFDITTLARKAIAVQPASNPQTRYTHNLVADLFDAPQERVAAPEGVYVSCLGTTRATAGSFAAQEKLDLGLNTDLAKRAKADGAEVVRALRGLGHGSPQLILVSSGGSSSSSVFPYTKMKGKLEDAVKAMDFGSCIILQPGVLLGPRNETRTAEYMAQTVFRGLRAIGLPHRMLMVDGDDVGACIAHLAANPPGDKVKVMSNSEIIAAAQQWREANAAAK